MVTLYTAAGCSRCKLVKRFMDERGIDYEEKDIKAEGKKDFQVFYKEHRAVIVRGPDGIEFPVFHQGDVVRQGIGAVIAYLTAGDRLDACVATGLRHGEWVDGVDVSAAGPDRIDDLAAVLGYIKEKGYKVEVRTSGVDAAALERLADQGLADRVIFELKGPPEYYQSRLDADPDDAARSMTLLDRFPEYEIRMVVQPLVRPDGETGYPAPDEVGRAAEWLKTATGRHNHPLVLAFVDPSEIEDERLKGVQPPAPPMKYRSAARRHQVAAEIEK